jgi:hypothetical protein
MRSSARMMLLGVWSVAGCDVFGRSCTLMGCSGTLTIFLDRDLAEDAEVVVDVGFETACSSDGTELNCQIGHVEGQPALIVSTAMGEPVDTVFVSISEGGEPAIDHEVDPVWDGEAFYPNGKQCGGSCTSGEADLQLD